MGTALPRLLLEETGHHVDIFRRSSRGFGGSVFWFLIAGVGGRGGKRRVAEEASARRRFVNGKNCLRWWFVSGVIRRSADEQEGTWDP